MKLAKITAVLAMLASYAIASPQGIVIYKTDGTKLNISSTSIEHIQVYPDNDEDYTKPETFNETNFSIAGYPVKSIDNETGIITVEMPFDVDRTSLAATFDLNILSEVYVDGVKQESDVTINDFSMPVRYVVRTADGSEYTYYVAICFSDMPVVYVDTNNQGINSKETYVEGINIYVTNHKNSGIYSSVNMKGRGNTSWTMPKKSYTMKLNKKDTFMGLKKHKTYALVANYADKTLLRNQYAYQMGRDIYDAMPWNPSNVNCHMIMDGNYQGIYSVTETIKIDSNRVNIPNLEDCQSIDSANDYGFLLEVDVRMDEYFNFTTTRGVCFSLKDPDGEDISEELRQYIQTKIQDIENALYSSNFTDPDSESYYRNFIDVPSFIDWYLVNEITKNNDAIFHSSCYMYWDPKANKLFMGPLWDFDISCGNINFNKNDNPEGLWVKGNTWHTQLFNDPQFVSELRDRFNETKEAVLALTDQTLVESAEALQSDAAYNFAAWDILGKYVWPNPDGYEDRDTYEKEVEYLVNWINSRMEWLDKEFNRD